MGGYNARGAYDLPAAGAVDTTLPLILSCKEFQLIDDGIPRKTSNDKLLPYCRMLRRCLRMLNVSHSWRAMAGI